MFFIASKVLGIFIQPLNLLAFLAVIGLLLLSSRRREAGKLLLVCVTGIYFIFANTQLPDLLLSSIEVVRDDKIIADNQADITGIIVLGGAINTNKANRREDYHINDAGERLVEAIGLAKDIPLAKLVYSGGDGSLIGNGGVDAVGFERVLTRLGGISNQVIYESRSKNTFQNAVFTKAALGEQIGGKWILVTSAFHMKRAAAIFRKTGFEILPWPTDYRAKTVEFPFLTSAAARNFWKLETWLHEVVGFTIYRMSGRL